ncbi:MAG: hypothetical protein M3441_03550 [Chloroflexota bacterium]|nr:hypothetical protein [Chloroflexota bacterium]
MASPASAGAGDTQVGATVGRWFGSHRLVNPWTIAAAIFAISRLAAYGGGMWGTKQFAALNPTLSSGGVAEMVLRWDAGLYVLLAINGYTWDPSFNAPVTSAFFPLYPFLIAALSTVLRWFTPGFDWGNSFHGSYVAAGLIISAICFYFILVLLVKLLAPRIGLAGASLVALGMAVLPTSFYLTALYTEGLFLMLVLLVFVLAHSRLPAKWLCVGLVGMLAALTRSAGVLLLAAMVLEYLRQRGWQWRKIRADILFLGLIPAGTAVYMAFLWWRFGDPWWVTKIQSVPPWSRHGGDPWTTYTNAVNMWWVSVTGGYPQGLDPILNTSQGSRLWHELDLALPLIMLAGAAVAWKKLYASEWVWLTFSIIFPLSTGSTQSMSRFVLTMWPGLVGLGMLGRLGKWGKWVAIPLLLASMALMAWCSAKFSMGKWVA